MPGILGVYDAANTCNRTCFSKLSPKYTHSKNQSFNLNLQVILFSSAPSHTLSATAMLSLKQTRIDATSFHFAVISSLD